MEEVWKIIEDYPMYYISNLGRVKSMYKKRLILKPGLDSDGYHIISLCKNTLKKTFTIHRLVALFFIPNPENKSQINHINGIKTDNSVNNLEWNTSSENIKHAYKIGLMKISELNKEVSAKKNIKRCSKKVINLLTSEEFFNAKIAAKHYGLVYGSLVNMLNGRRKNNTNLIYDIDRLKSNDTSLS